MATIFIITENNQFLITEGGDYLIIDENQFPSVRRRYTVLPITNRFTVKPIDDRYIALPPIEHKLIK